MGVVEVLDPVAPARAGGWKVDVSRGERNGRVSSEWFNRPDDERYLSLDDLWANVKGRSERSRSRVVQTADIRVEAARDNPERLHLMLPKAHEPVAPTHWAFGQLASIVGAPASYLRQLPAPLAGINLMVWTAWQGAGGGCCNGDGGGRGGGDRRGREGLAKGGAAARGPAELPWGGGGMDGTPGGGRRACELVRGPTDGRPILGLRETGSEEE